MVQGMEMLFALFSRLAMFLYGMDRMAVPYNGRQATP